MTRLKECVTVDFETDGIQQRPVYPPVPVGVAIRWPDRTKEYLSWGHPNKNNSTMSQARDRLWRAWQVREGVLFHHCIFDMDVAEVHLGLPMPKVFHDTLYMAFLLYPYELSLSLKPLAEKYADMPPAERDELKEWILANIKGSTPKKWGEHIAKAPGDLVGRYAKGDVTRTYALAQRFYKDIVARNMVDAYERELKVTHITLGMERTGVRLDVKGVRKAQGVFQQMSEDMAKGIQKRLHADRGGKLSPDFNVNSPTQLGEALVASGKLDAVIKTKTGKVSTKIANLKATCNDKTLLEMLSVYSVAEKYTSTFFTPWLEQADRTGGRLLPTFNQVRNRDDSGGGGGARSGRYSSSKPNMQTVSANPEDSQNKETLMLMQSWLLDRYQFKFAGLRDYILPDEGKVLISVDYNQQELRIFAHFEQDVLMRAYIADPRLDIHEFCRQLVFKATGVLYERKHIKITVFGIIYGMGVGKLADRLEVDMRTAKLVKNGIMEAVPGIGRLVKGLKLLAQRDEPLVTWGGRQYYCEEPKYFKDDDEWRTFEYKMLNYKIQPSAADCTKQGMINVDTQVPEARIALQVHDELVCMASEEEVGERIIKAMCDVKFDVPMLADAKYSRKSWARAK